MTFFPALITKLEKTQENFFISYLKIKKTKIKKLAEKQFSGKYFKIKKKEGYFFS